jgi:MotA/TolQ/ExbB proton channel family protein
MSIRSSQRSTRELFLLVLAVAAVGGICVFLNYWTKTPIIKMDSSGKWTPERFGRLLLGPEQIACYCFFTWACLILARREGEVRRQRSAFGLDLLPTEEGARILPEDARPLMRKVDMNTANRGPLILGTMVRMALGKFAMSRSAPDVGEVVRTQADVEQYRLVSGMTIVQYLLWAIPAIGFIGTVRGLAGSFTMASSDEQDLSRFMGEASRHLNFAFDCTLVALVLSVIAMYFLHYVQRDEENLIIDCQQYCQEHLLLRLYDPQPEHAEIGNRVAV